jgi:hypothetical protein
MKNLIMTVLTASSLTLATAPVFALKAPLVATKVPAVTSSKTMKTAHVLKNKNAVVEIKKTK